MKTTIEPTPASAPETRDPSVDANSASASIRREVREDGLVLLTFDRPDSSANIFDRETLLELEAHLDWIAEKNVLRGLILRSAKPSIFLAGADIKSLSTLREEELEAFIELGQRVFSKLAHLPLPKVAAIHGVCVGGGLEVALACDWRVVSDDHATKLGLPETMLGILPAWGGSTRLPRLIGLPKALSLILTGKMVDARHAVKLGVADAYGFPEKLEELAHQYIDRGQRKKKGFPLLHNPLSREIIRIKAKGDVLKQSGGNYPAPVEALNVAVDGVGRSEERSLLAEREAVLRLAKTPQAANLIRVFNLQERSKKRRYATEAGVAPKTIASTAVIGAGVMGSGIAQWLSSRQLPVILQDISAERVAAGLKSIYKLYAGGVKRHLFTKTEAERRSDLITPAHQPVPLKRCDLVIEAATEDLAIKRKIFADLCRRTSDETVLATNTSALPLKGLVTSEGVTHPERIVGLHFFNPVHRMKLVEIVVTDTTTGETVETALKFVRQIGKLPVVVKDHPGFLVNRILMPYLIEAGRLYDRGVDPEVIDAAMRDFGMPMGPLRLLDEVGLDVALHVARTMEKAFGSRMSIPEVFTRIVDSGNFGRKAGHGFYRYGGKGEPKVSQAALNCRTALDREPANLTREDIQDRLVLLMVNEAFRCLEEGVTDSPEDVDFAMIMGTGFAPFRGGPMRYAETEGLKKVAGRLVRLAEEEGERFSPCGLLMEKAQD